MNNYNVKGPGLPAGGTDNVTLIVYRGFTYDLDNQSGSSHPLRIQSTTGLSGTEYTTGVSGDKEALQTFTVPLDAPATLYYQCTAHTNMTGSIDVR